jgi:tRNA pseudouridine13 synthase
MSSVHERDLDEAGAGNLPKRLKVEPTAASGDNTTVEGASGRVSVAGHHLPPSHVLLSCEPSPGTLPQLSEVDVGISEYVGRRIPMVEGIIKQR